MPFIPSPCLSLISTLPRSLPEVRGSYQKVASSLYFGVNTQGVAVPAPKAQRQGGTPGPSSGQTSMLAASTGSGSGLQATGCARVTKTVSAPGLTREKAVQGAGWVWVLLEFFEVSCGPGARHLLHADLGSVCAVSEPREEVSS